MSTLSVLSMVVGTPKKWTDGQRSGDKEISGTLRVSDIRFSNVWLPHIEADVSFQMSTLRFSTCFGLLFRNGANVVAHPVVFFGIAESVRGEIIIVSSDGCFLLRC